MAAKYDSTVDLPDELFADVLVDFMSDTSIRPNFDDLVLHPFGGNMLLPEDVHVGPLFVDDSHIVIPGAHGSVVDSQNLLDMVSSGVSIQPFVLEDQLSVNGVPFVKLGSHILGEIGQYSIEWKEALMCLKSGPTYNITINQVVAFIKCFGVDDDENLSHTVIRFIKYKRGPFFYFVLSILHVC
jgi:hypothetical protein